MVLPSVAFDMLTEAGYDSKIAGGEGRGTSKKRESKRTTSKPGYLYNFVHI